MNNKTYNFSGKTVLITGGTRGIGKGIAELFLSAGATVVVCGRNQPPLLPSVDDREALFCQCDVRDPESSQQLIDFCQSQTNRLDILINNAGGSPEVAAEQASPRFIQSIIALNLTAPAVLSQQAHAAMTESEGEGVIINIASVSAIRPSPGTAVYGAAKAGLVNLTRSLAQEWAPAVRVNVIIAGLARTEAAAEHYGGEAGIQKIEQRMPMQRMATPGDIARACCYLASDDAAYVSGATLEVHGGGEPPSFLSLQND
ncbi:MAG: SDR family oxidoreductase [Gammaproteobacteria bacterium]|nr:SDR family oxidoreductase [Gammaproteobacteria bacterium]